MENMAIENMAMEIKTRLTQSKSSFTHFRTYIFTYHEAMKWENIRT